MTITLYRSGGLTPLSDIPNDNSKMFDSEAESLTQKNPNRSSSVYASFSLSEVELNWSEYRYDCGRDASLYKIVIPEHLINEDIYAYSIEAYEEFSYYWAEAPTEAGEYVKDYMETRIPLNEWAEHVGYLSSEEIAKYEILIPYHIATQCEWSEVGAADLDDWYLTSELKEPYLVR